LAFIGKNRSRWVGAGVTVGEGHRIMTVTAIAP
jgi:hypothetical protein